ncbi:hypothetical protein GCM10020254_13470 [Streptomyces goshikiensis]
MNRLFWVLVRFFWFCRVYTSGLLPFPCVSRRGGGGGGQLGGAQFVDGGAGQLQRRRERLEVVDAAEVAAVGAAHHVQRAPVDAHGRPGEVDGDVPAAVRLLGERRRGERLPWPPGP